MSDRLIKEMVELSQGNDKLIREILKTLAAVTENIKVTERAIDTLTVHAEVLGDHVKALTLRVGELERESEAERAARPHGYGPI